MAQLSDELTGFDRWQQLSWLLEWVEIENLCRILELRHELACALLASSDEPQKRRQYYQTAVKIQDSMTKMLLPWLEEKAKSNKSDSASLVKTWEKLFGDPNSPEVRARIEETARKMLEESNS